jgi:glycine cleavage system regulatory protein
MSPAPNVRGHRKFGWADDIVAPRQEIDTLSLLHEEASIQRRLDGAELTAGNFLDKYREARNHYREKSQARAWGQELTESEQTESQETEPTWTARLAQGVAVFGAQASIRARRQSRSRSVLICSCADRSGVLAALSEAVADEGGNILSAFMSAVAGHLVTALLLSGSSIDPETAQQRVSDQTQQQPDDDVRIVCTPLKTNDVYWARPGSGCWHASARFRGDASLLLALTGAIHEHEIPLVAASSWLEADAETNDDRVQVVDLNFAVNAGPRGEDLRVIRDIEAKVTESRPGVQLNIVPVTWPTRSWSHDHAKRPNSRVAVMTVVGHARPGFVHDTLRTLIDGVEAVVEIRSVSMALLEGASVLTIMFTRSRQSRLRDVDQQIRTKLTSTLAGSDQSAPIAVQIVKAAKTNDDGQRSKGETHPSRASGPDWPTHELSIVAVEQPRVVAKVARLLAGSNVNIIWFVSHVLDPMVGERWPMYAIQMHIHVPPDLRDEVGARLRTLADTERWEDVSMREWSLADGADVASGH